MGTDRSLVFAGRADLGEARMTSQRVTIYDYPATATAPDDGRFVSSCIADHRLAYERMQDERYDALLGCNSGASLVVLKLTYHPNWHVTVDDRDVPTYLVSPGFIGFEVPSG